MISGIKKIEVEILSEVCVKYGRDDDICNYSVNSARCSNGEWRRSGPGVLVELGALLRRRVTPEAVAHPNPATNSAGVLAEFASTRSKFKFPGRGQKAVKVVPLAEALEFAFCLAVIDNIMMLPGAAAATTRRILHKRDFFSKKSLFLVFLHHMDLYHHW